MNKIDKAFFSVIKNFIIREEHELKLMNPAKGIFHMPELAMVYQIGKEIMNHKELIFGDVGVDWKREEKLGKGGINDLAFDVTGKVKELFIFEFKMRNKRTMYKKDIQKLQSFKGDNKVRVHKYFCALIGEDEKERNNKDTKDFKTCRRMYFVDLIEPTGQIKRVGNFEFKEKTEQRRYTKRDIFPNLCLWKIM